MMNVPEEMKSITHPLISSIYLKKDYGAEPGSQDVLVIKTNFDDVSDEYSDYDTYLMELLTDLDELKAQAEDSVGHFDRIDIRA
jgi:hypothetical protein